jgi:hypothetical protein
MDPQSKINLLEAKNMELEKELKKEGISKAERISIRA